MGMPESSFVTDYASRPKHDSKQCIDFIKTIPESCASTPASERGSNLTMINELSEVTKNTGKCGFQTESVSDFGNQSEMPYGSTNKKDFAHTQRFSAYMADQPKMPLSKLISIVSEEQKKKLLARPNSTGIQFNFSGSHSRVSSFAQARNTMQTGMQQKFLGGSTKEQYKRIRANRSVLQKHQSYEFSSHMPATDFPQTHRMPPSTFAVPKQGSLKSRLRTLTHNKDQLVQLFAQQRMSILALQSEIAEVSQKVNRIR